MKKIITSVLVLVLLAACCCTVLTACDNRDYDYTIVLYTQQNDNLQGITQTAIDRFEAKYPGWHVDHQVQSGGYNGLRNKISADLPAKKQPDIAYCYADHVSLYMQSGQVIDVSKYINNTGYASYVPNANEVETTEELITTNYVIGYTEDEIANFIESYYNEGKATNFTDYDKYGFTADAMLMMPFAKSTEVMYYNQNALDAVGLKPAETWDELWAQIPTLQAAYPNATVLGYDSESNWFITESERQGWGYTSTDANNHYLFNNDQAAAWLDSLKGYRTQIQSQQKYEAYTSNLFKLGVGKKADGTSVDKGDGGGVIYCVGSTGGAKNQATNNFTVGVTHVPYSKINGQVLTGEAGNSDLCISQGPSFVMLKSQKAKNPDQKALMTWMFLKELYNPSILAAVAQEQGYCSPMYDTAEQVEEYANFLKGTSVIAQATKIAEELSKSGKVFTSPAFVGSSNARDQVGNALLSIINGTAANGKLALQEAYNNCL